MAPLRIEAPTAGPASSTSGVSPRASRCAAAARPTGPAPITATGNHVVFEDVPLVLKVDVVTVEKPRLAGGSAAGEAVDQPLERIDDGRLVEAVVDLATLLACPDQTGALQDQEVMRYGRAAQRDARGDIADVEFLPREELHEVLAGGIGERVEKVAARNQVVAQLPDFGTEGVRRHQAADILIANNLYRLKHINILRMFGWGVKLS